MAELDVFHLAHQVPIVETIRNYLPLQNRNGKYYGLCPFHEDRTIGSFVVFSDASSKKRGWFQCYACGEKGDNIDFVRRYLQVGYREAAITIAENALLLCHSDADALRKNSSTVSEIVVPEQKKILQKQEILAQRQSPPHLDRVYRCFAAAADPLPPPLQEILLSSRRIPENSLGNYFLFPAQKDLRFFWERFRRNLSAEFQTDNPYALADILIGVPGFYVGKNKRVVFSTSNEKRIGVMVFNRNRQVSGIQTRAAATLDGVIHSKEEKAARYRFLSSGYANGAQRSPGILGCSCGFIEDVLFPPNGIWNRAIAVTEGRFKAELLASLGFLVVNMHSISNGKAAGRVALELADAVRARQFVLCYDREPRGEGHENVFKSAANLYEQLGSVLLTEFAVWDPSLGKGIDDVIHAGYIKEISRVPAQEYFRLHQAA